MTDKKVDKVRDKRLINYFCLTFVIAWLIWLPLVLHGVGLLKLSPGVLELRWVFISISAFSPLTAALIVLTREKGSKAIKPFLLKAVDWPVKGVWIVASLLIPVSITATAHYISIFTRLDQLPKSLIPETFPLPLMLTTTLYFALVLFLGGGQEEFGWRGYAQEPMQERFGMVRGSALLGLIWGLWHLPLWFMPGAGQIYYPFIAFVIMTTSMSAIIGWLYNAGGKKLILAILAHAASNMSIPFFPILHMESAKHLGYWVWVGLTATVAIFLVFSLEGYEYGNKKMVKR